MRRTLLFLVVVVACSPSLRAADDEDEVSWVDKFKDPQLTGYQVEGDVAWSKSGGGIRIGGKPKSFVAREAAMGFIAEARMDVWFPKGLGKERGLYLSLRERSAVNHTTVYLGQEDGKPFLGVMESPIGKHKLPAVGNDPVEGPWIVRIRLRYGVVQAKAWRKNDPEPRDWQVTRYTGDSGWEPRIVAVYATEGEMGILERLAVNGVRPATDLFLKPDKELTPAKEELVEFMRKAVLFRKQGEIRKSLDAAGQALKAARKAYGDEHAVTANCHHNLAAMLHDSGRYEDALKEFEDALRIRRKVLPRNHPHIASSLAGVGVTLATLGRLKESEKILRETLEARRKVLGDAHPETAIAWNNLGSTLSARAEHPEALECLRKSLKIRQSVFGNNYPDTAKAHNNVGVQLFMMGEYREALPHYEAALTCYRQFYEPEHPNHPDIAMAENNLGFLLMAMGRLSDAQVHLDTAQTIYKKMGQANHPTRATILNNLGILASQAGDHVAARTYLEEAFEIRKAVFKLDNPATATVRMNLAMTLWALKDRSAIREFAAALKVLSETLPPDHPTLAQALQNLAVWSIDDQDKEFVRGLLTRALAMKRTKLGDHHPETILTLNNLAFYLMETGSATDAEKLLTDTLKVCIDKLGPENPLTCLVEHNLGAAAYSLRNYAAAEKHLRVAVKGFAKAHGQQHPDTSRSRNMLAYTLAAQGKHEAALEEASAAATGYARSARKLLVGVPEGQHAALLGEWRPEVRMFLGLAVATPDKLGTHASALWTTVMDWKATSGRALLDRLEALIIAPVPEAREKYQELRDRRRQLLQAIMRGAGSEGIESYNARVAKEQEQVERLERELVGRVQGYSAVAKLREASPAEVARHIPEGAVLLEFLYIEPQSAKAQPKGVPGTEASYAAIVVSPRAGAEPSIKLVPLGKAADVEAAIEDWRKITLNGKRDSTVDESLRKRVWDPIAKVLPEGTKQLVIAPAGQIALIPFEAVWEPATATSGEFLVEKYLISYCSTGRDLIPRPAAPGRLGPAVVVADPDYDLAGFPKAGPPPMRIHPAAGSISPLAFANNPRPQQRLKGFEVEADSITKLLRAKFADTPPKSLRTDEATEERVQSLARPRVLYFITHGDYLEDRRTLAALEGRPLAAPPLRSADDPLTLLTPEEFGDDPRVRSFLYLAGANRWKERAKHGLSDGLFTAREIQDMDLWGTDLVVASACKTGLGDVWVGEGVLSLRRAFQQAGARTVVSSLWSVEDEKTAKLMARFVELWGQNMPKASALRKAQLEMITSLRRAGKKRPSDAPPFFWAPFICHGQPD